MKDKFKVGLVGCGAMGRSVAKMLLSKSNQVAVDSIYDPEPVSVKRTLASVAPQAIECTSMDELLSRDIGWVMIASWNSAHAQQSIQSLEAGKHVFCQKPLGISLEECIRMRDAWQKTDRQFVIGFTLRFSPHYRRIKELLDAGMIGDIVSLEFNETLPFYHGGYIMGDWRRLKENAGSHLLEKCCHDIDVINWMVDSKVNRVASFGGLNFFTPENEHQMQRLGSDEKGRPAYQQWVGLIDENPFTSEKNIADNQVVILEFENEVRASFHLNANAGMPERRLYICGTEGTVRADVLTGKIEVQRIGFNEKVEDFSTAAAGLHGGGDEVLAQELAEIMTQSRAPQVGMKEGLAAATICFAIDDAMESGTVVHLEPLWKKQQ